jgi:centrosomal protein CEP41
MDKISDKRTIAQKYGDKGGQDKKLKENPKYKQITKVIDTGSTIKSNQFMSDQLISKRKSEMFKRVKGSTIIKLIKAAQANQTESIYNLGSGEPNISQPQEDPKDDNKSITSQQTAKSNITNVTAVTYATEMLGNLSDIDFIILDLREACDYERIHLKEAVSFPAVNISRDKFTHQLIMMKNKPGKMIILYHNDERNGIPYANNFFQKGYDNVYFLSGGIEEFAKNFPEHLEGPEKEKYVNMKKEKDRQAKLAEDKKNGKASKYHPCAQIKKENNNKNINALKKNLEKK